MTEQQASLEEESIILLGHMKHVSRIQARSQLEDTLGFFMSHEKFETVQR